MHTLGRNARNGRNKRHRRKSGSVRKRDAARNGGIVLAREREEAPREAADSNRDREDRLLPERDLLTRKKLGGRLRKRDAHKNRQTRIKGKKRNENAERKKLGGKRRTPIQKNKIGGGKPQKTRLEKRRIEKRKRQKSEPGESRKQNLTRSTKKTGRGTRRMTHGRPRRRRGKKLGKKKRNGNKKKMRNADPRNIRRTE